MKRLSSLGWVLPVVCVGLGALSGCSDEQAPAELASGDGAVQLEELRRLSAVPLEVALDQETGRLTTLRGRVALPGRSAEEAAQSFLVKYAPILRVAPNLEDLRLVAATSDLGGSTVRFAQEYEGVPVFDGALVLGFDPGGALVHVVSDYVPDLLVPVTPALSADNALALAEASVGEPLPASTSPRLVVVLGDREHDGHYLVWQVTVALDLPVGSWHLFFDAQSGELVRSIDLVKRAGAACVSCDPTLDPGCGSLFLPNAVDAADDPSLRDTSNVDAYQVGCALGNLTSSTRLDGAYANTGLTTNRIGPPYNQLRSNNQQAVDEVNTYYHANRAKGYLDQLGFPAVMSYSISINAHDSSVGDNSYYSGQQLHFGDGGVDDAQDGDVVYHEYGHAIQDNQVPNYGLTDEGGATGEGFGDYWAAAVTDDADTTQLGLGCVAPWDATAYNPYNGTLGTGCLRRVDGTQQYPRDFVWEVHEDGKMWSAALWRLRNTAGVGAGVADSLVIKAHTFLTASAKFINAADALLSADSALYGGAHSAAIHDAMKAQGIPRTGTAASSTGVTSSVNFSCQTPHNYQNYGYKECIYTKPGAARVRFHFTAFNTEAGYDVAYISDANFRQVQALSGKPFGGGNSGAAGYSAAVAGDTIVLRFKADYTVVRYGFVIDKVYYSNSP